MVFEERIAAPALAYGIAFCLGIPHQQDPVAAFWQPTIHTMQNVMTQELLQPSKIVNALGLENAMFEAADPDVFAW